MSTYTDYTDYTDSQDYAEVDVYDESTSCCCGSAEAPVFEEWAQVEPVPSYDEMASVWTTPESEASAVIPAGQPGGPQLEVSSATAVMPAGQPGTFEPASDFGTGFSSYGTAIESPTGAPIYDGTGFSSYGTAIESPTGAPIYDGTGFSSYGTAIESPTGAPIYDGTGFSSYGTAMESAVSSWGVGPAQPTGPMFEPTTMTISTSPSPLSQIYGVAAANGDIMSQLAVRDIMASQAFATSIWLTPSIIW